MKSDRAPDVVVVGSGPNGLAAAITLARAGRSVVVYEAAATPGGGIRSAALTLPGYVHDVCSTIHGVALASPFFRTVDLASRGVTWIQPDAPAAHPLDDGRAAILERDVHSTANGLDALTGSDGRAWRRLFGPLVASAERLLPELLGPVVHVPRRRGVLPLMRFGPRALLSARLLATTTFRDEPARALFGGLAAHSMVALDRAATASFGLVLGTVAHAYGWPMARGGSGTVADALVAELRSLGGEVVTGRRIASLADLPPARAIVLDVTPHQVVAIGGDRLPAGYRRRLDRFRYGPGVFKLDWALDGPIPWKNASVARAATVHLGGRLDEIRSAEADVAAGRHPDRPYVILVQHSRFDPTRAPAGKHTAWAYCHVPNDSSVDMTHRIESQIERFAPGFRELVLARSRRDSRAVQAYDENAVGGDINGGIQDLRQLIFRPTPGLDPYATPVRGLYLCSSSTPPGGGVHGMSGFHAAQSVLRREFR
ncbi:MAG TPA: NAD(P)/FAD-dependent oxidoreductase [Candidatus Saccharimonadales bacterium]|nr:NAD(P)/FAD-dependent oxidoreductase [Candidatus Saccharimonadales bacterium]